MKNFNSSFVVFALLILTSCNYQADVVESVQPVFPEKTKKTIKMNTTEGLYYTNGQYDLSLNQNTLVPYDQNGNIAPSGSYSTSDQVALNTTTGYIDLQATVTNWPITAGTYRLVTISYEFIINNTKVEGTSTLKLYKYTDAENVPMELMEAGGTRTRNGIIIILD